MRKIINCIIDIVYSEIDYHIMEGGNGIALGVVMLSLFHELLNKILPNLSKHFIIGNSFYDFLNNNGIINFLVYFTILRLFLYIIASFRNTPPSDRQNSIIIALSISLVLFLSNIFQFKIILLSLILHKLIYLSMFALIIVFTSLNKIKEVFCS